MATQRLSVQCRDCICNIARRATKTDADLLELRDSGLTIAVPKI